MDKELLEKRLKHSKIGFWVNFVCVLINLGLFYITHHWYPIAVAILMAALAFAYNEAGKSILKLLGRDK